MSNGEESADSEVMEEAAGMTQEASGVEMVLVHSGFAAGLSQACGMR